METLPPPHHFITLKDSDSNLLPLWCDGIKSPFDFECCSYGRRFPFCVSWTLYLAALSNIYCCVLQPYIGVTVQDLSCTHLHYSQETTNLHPFLLPALSPAFLYFCSSFIGFLFFTPPPQVPVSPPSLVRCLFRTHLKETKFQTAESCDHGHIIWV